MKNFWAQWVDDEGDTRECGPLNRDQAERIARQTQGWVIGFTETGSQYTVSNYYRVTRQIEKRGDQNDFEITPA
jgi:hypothetical protein